MTEAALSHIANIILCICIIFLLIQNSNLSNRIKSISMFIDMDTQYIEKKLKVGFNSDKDEFMFNIRLNIYSAILRLLKD